MNWHTRLIFCENARRCWLDVQAGILEDAFLRLADEASIRGQAAELEECERALALIDRLIARCRDEIGKEVGRADGGA